MDSTSIILLCVQLIGSFALLLFGMKYMSETLQCIAGQRFRNVLARLTSNSMEKLT